MKHLCIVISVVFIPVLLLGCVPHANEKRLTGFIIDHTARIEPLTTKANLAYWDASTTGRPEDYDKLSGLQLKIRKIYSDPHDFAMLKEIKDSGVITDPTLARQLDKLYYYLITFAFSS